MDHELNGEVIDKGNYRTRKTLESWRTAVIANSGNNYRPLPKQYAMLVNMPSLSVITSCYIYSLTHTHL